MTGGLAALLLIAAAPSGQETIEARNIVLKDGAGVRRAALMTLSAGPLLALYDDQGELRAGLRLRDNNPELVMMDEDGEERIALGLGDKGAGLALKNFDATTVTAIQEASMTLSDSQAKVIWRAQ